MGVYSDMYTQQQWLSMTCTHNNNDYDMYTQQQWLWHVHTTTMNPPFL